MSPITRLLRPSDKCLSLIKSFEGYSLNSYPDPASPRAADPSNRKLSGDPWTVGYGTTGPWVREGVSISSEEASRLLQERVLVVGRLVLEPLVNTVTQGQLDALTSLTYNIGIGNFRGSTLLRLMNEKRPLEAAKEFDKWIFAKGKALAGLKSRRMAEKALFLS